MKHVTHEWTGTPHASESIKRVDGVEVARNLVVNPSFEAGITGWSAGSQVYLDSRAQWTPPFGDRGLSVRTPNGGNGRGIAVLGAEISVEPGKWVAFSVWFRRSVGNLDQIRLDFDLLDYGAMQEFPQDDSWHHFRRAIQVPSGTEGITPSFRTVGHTGAHEYGADGVHIAVTDTEAEALAQVESYFDGDTEDYFTMPLFKVRANGAWNPVAPKAFLGGAFRNS